MLYLILILGVDGVEQRGEQLVDQFVRTVQVEHEQTDFDGGDGVQQRETDAEVGSSGI